jgi:catalase
MTLKNKWRLNKMEKITDLARKNAIATLEKMKIEEDKGAHNAASYDGPNAGWHRKTAEENKKIIDDFIFLLSAKPYESIKTRVIDAIIKESIKTGMQK